MAILIKAVSFYPKVNPLLSYWWIKLIQLLKLPNDEWLKYNYVYVKVSLIIIVICYIKLNGL